ncbi:MAG: hypothetical protein AB1Z98_28075, partial [Nannocystaceae bacterium]
QGERSAGLAMLREALADTERDHEPYAPVLRVVLVRMLLLHDGPQAALAELDRKDSTDAADLLRARGEALRRLGRLDEADAALDRARAILDVRDSLLPPQRADVFVERSLVATARGQRSEAIVQARAALAALGGWGEANDLDRARARAHLAMVLMDGDPTRQERSEAVALARRARVAYAAHGPAFAIEQQPLDALLGR